MRPLDVEDMEGEAERGGERGMWLEIRRLRASLCAPVGSVVPDDIRSSMDDTLFCSCTFRSVCRLFWNQTVTERSSLWT